MKNLNKRKFVLALLTLIFSIYFSIFFHELGHYVSGLQLNCKSYISVRITMVGSSGGCTEQSWNSLTGMQKAYSALTGQIFTLILGAPSLIFLIKKKFDYKIFYLLLFLVITNFWILFYNSIQAIFFSGLDWRDNDFGVVSAGYGINQIFFVIPSVVFLSIIVFSALKFFRELLKKKNLILE